MGNFERILMGVLLIVVIVVAYQISVQQVSDEQNIESPTDIQEKIPAFLKCIGGELFNREECFMLVQYQQSDETYENIAVDFLDCIELNVFNRDECIKLVSHGE